MRIDRAPWMRLHLGSAPRFTISLTGKGRKDRKDVKDCRDATFRWSLSSFRSFTSFLGPRNHLRIAGPTPKNGHPRPSQDCSRRKTPIPQETENPIKSLRMKLTIFSVLIGMMLCVSALRAQEETGSPYPRYFMNFGVILL